MSRQRRTAATKAMQQRRRDLRDFVRQFTEFRETPEDPPLRYAWWIFDDPPSNNEPDPATTAEWHALMAKHFKGGSVSLPTRVHEDDLLGRLLKDEEPSCP